MSMDGSRILAGTLASLLGALALAGCGGGGGRGSKLAFSPSPGSPVASPQTQISIRGASAAQLQDVTVTGSRSGRHAGRLVPYPEGDGASFLPAQPFTPGETVKVGLREGSAKPIRFHFTIAQPVSVPAQPSPPGSPTKPGQVQSFHSAPGLRPPSVNVTRDAAGTAPGDIFLSPKNLLGQAGPMILDAAGRLIWFHPVSGKEQAFDFTKQHYQGKPVLTWWQGIVNSRGFGLGEDVIYGTSYRQLVTVKAGNGYRADLHEFVMTPQGTALITAYDPVRMDLSSVGGPRDGAVLDGVVQEVYVRTGLVLFEWHSLGHVALDESYVKPAPDGLFDHFHVNSVALDADGNLILSARNTWAIYKINHRTGQIMWRLGGKRSSFKMGRGTQFAYQHDARRQPDGTITLFDNGASPKVHPESRAIALRLDMKSMTVTLAREWRHPSKILAGSQGNMQVLPNGNRFVGWGGEPNLTEFSPDGRILFDAALAAPDTSYRAFRFPWNATPTGRPALATSPGPGDRLTVYASWNGATAIARWRILAGAGPQALKPLSEAARTGFETRMAAFTRDPYVAVQALDASGSVLGTSQAVKPGSRAAGS